MCIYKTYSYLAVNPVLHPGPESKAVFRAVVNIQHALSFSQRDKQWRAPVQGELWPSCRSDGGDSDKVVANRDVRQQLHTPAVCLRDEKR